MRKITPVDAKDVHFLVVGSIHLDILATATSDEDPMDKIGNVAIEIG